MPSLIAALEQAGLVAVFVLVLVEQLGLPLPSYPLLLLAGAWSVQGSASAPRVVLVAVGAALLADLGWYLAGQRLGSRVLRTMCALSLEPDSCVSGTERVFHRFGTRALLFAKFVPGLGAVATAMCGVVGASLLGFIAYDVLGATLWAGSAVLAGRLFHAAIDDALGELGRFGGAGSLLLALLLGAFLALKLWRRHQFLHELRMSRISVAELRELLQEGAEPTIVDARPAPSRERDGMIPGAVSIEWLRDDPRGRSRTTEVVVYCACPNEATAARIAKQLQALGYARVRPLAGGIHAWTDAGFPTAQAPPDGPAPTRGA